MNANEQLDFYNPDSIYYGNSRHYIQQLENKVRQQQAEIEALKQIIDANNLNQNIGQFVKPTNEPVAWMYNYENFPDSFVVCRARKSDQDIPLYTHPVKEQDESFDRTASHMAGEYVSYKAELTDEEIDGFTVRIYNCRTGAEAHEIVLAILRKASEK